MKREITISQELHLSHQRMNDGWVLCPKGAIDSNTSEGFRSRIQQLLEEDAAAPHLLLDMSGVKYISSIGLGALIHLLKQSQQTGSSFGLYDPQLAVQRVLEISKLDFLLVKPAESGTLGPFAEYVQSRESQKAAAAPPPAPAPGKPKKK
jgi:anti-anti-sigma factor